MLLLFQTGVAKRSVYFETSVPQQRAVNIEIGGRGARRRAKTHINTKSVIFSRTGFLLEHNYSHRDRINCSFMNTNVHIALNVCVFVTRSLGASGHLAHAVCMNRDAQPCLARLCASCLLPDRERCSTPVGETEPDTTDLQSRHPANQT